MLANLLAAFATGVSFALMYWALNVMSEAVLFNVVAFVLGVIAECFRRWLARETS